MIKPSKYLLAFASLFVLLGTGLLVTSSKFLPILLQHTVYYCQTTLSSFSTRIPGGIGTFLTGILVLLVGYTLAKLTLTYLKIISFRKRLHVEVAQNDIFRKVVQKLSLDNKAYLINDIKPFAFCYGIRRPKIYVSTKLLEMISPTELEAILRHEQYHLEHKDPFIMLLAEVAKSLFPFFPLLSDLIHNYKIEREISADYQVTQNLGTSNSLISVLKKLLLCDPIEQYAFAPALADHESLEVRIKALVHKDYSFARFKFFNIVVSLLSIGLFTVLVTAPVQAVELHNEHQDVMMVCMQGNECAQWCKKNATVIPRMTKSSNASVLYSTVSSSN